MSFKIKVLCLIFCSVALVGGQKLGRILNGDPGNTRPYQLYLQAFNESEDNMDYGAGVLVAPRVVLTVASLIKGFERWILRYGSNIFGQLSSIESTVAFLHPNFRAGEQFNLNDIGIVLLPSAIVGSVSPISLPETEVQIPRMYEEGQITNFETNLADPTQGFTATSVLRSAFLTVFPQNACNTTFPNIPSTVFCAFDDHYLSNLCAGDRGTAFSIVFRGVDTLAGITSKVSPNCDDRSTFTQIQPYIEWIKVVGNL